MSEVFDSDELVEIEDEPQEQFNYSNKKIVGMCKRCGKTVYAETMYQDRPFVLCKDCAKAIKQRKLEKETAIKEKAHRSISSSLKKGYFFGGIVATLILVGVLINVFSGEFGVLWVLVPGAILSYCVFAIAFEVSYDDSWVADMFLWFANKPFGMPGIIFDLSIDGIIFFILVKLGLAILSFLIGVFLFIFGFVLAMIFAPFTFPFTYYRAKKEIN